MVTLNVCAYARARAYLGGEEGEKKKKEKKQKKTAFQKHQVVMYKGLSCLLCLFSVPSYRTGLPVTTWDKPKEAFPTLSDCTRAWSEPPEVTTPLPIQYLLICGFAATHTRAFCE